MARANLSIVPSPAKVSDIQVTGDPIVSPQMTFNPDDAKALGSYARIAADQLHKEAAHIRVSKLGDEAAKVLEREAATAELLASIIQHHVG